MHVLQGAAGSPTSKWERCYGFPARPLALACKAGALKDPGESEYFLRTVEQTKVPKAKIPHILPVGTVWESNNADVCLLGNNVQFNNN